jgi:DNA gyrase subunit A
MWSRNEALPLEVEIRQTTASLHIHQAVSRLLDEPHALLDVVLQAEDSEAANAALRERFGFDEIQATAVMDQQLRRVTRRDRQRIEEVVEELVDRLAVLRDLEDQPPGWETPPPTR